MSQVTESIHIPLKTIKADESFNCRHDYGDIEGLAKDIKRDGQLSPMLVVSNGKGYALVSGFRRMRALKLLKSETGEVKIIEAKEEQAVYFMNVSENLARKDLTSYETANACAIIKKKFNLKSVQIKNRLTSLEHISKGHLNNLIRARENLDPKIINDWKNNDNIPTSQLFKWASLDRGEQIEAWEEHTGEAVAVVGEDEEQQPSNAKKKKASEGILRDAMAYVKENVGAERVREAMLATLKFAVGDVKTLRENGVVIFDPVAVKKEAKAEKEAERKEEKEEAKAKKENEKAVKAKEKEAADKAKAKEKLAKAKEKAKAEQVKIKELEAAAK